MEAICCFETSVDTQRTTRRYIPGDNTVTRLVTVDGYWIDNWIYYNCTLKYNTTESLRTPPVLQFTTEYITTIPQPS
jgi:hypothetical protein